MIQAEISRVCLDSLRPYGGEGGIRTPGASEGTRDFESRRLNLTPEPLRTA
jgi:hypothetical protein